MKRTKQDQGPQLQNQPPQPRPSFWAPLLMREPLKAGGIPKASPAKLSAHLLCAKHSVLSTLLLACRSLPGHSCMNPTSPADGHCPPRPHAPGLHCQTFHLALMRTSGQAWQDGCSPWLVNSWAQTTTAGGSPHESEGHIPGRGVLQRGPIHVLTGPEDPQLVNLWESPGDTRVKTVADQDLAVQQTPHTPALSLRRLASRPSICRHSPREKC